MEKVCLNPADHPHSWHYPIADAVIDAVEMLYFFTDVSFELGRDHTDLAFVGPRYELIGFCHNSVQFKGLTYSTSDLVSDTFLTAAR